MSQARTMSDAVLQRWCKPLTGDVLSIGSASDRDGNGGTYRQYFRSASSYTTSEVTPTPGCDLVLDVRAMPKIDSERFDVVFCSGVLEHVDDPWSAVAECHRVLRRNGIFLVGVPFQQRLHRAPQDFWRFTEYGVRHLLKAFQIEAIEAIGTDVKFPWTYWVKARKEATC